MAKESAFPGTRGAEEGVGVVEGKDERAEGTELGLEVDEFAAAFVLAVVVGERSEGLGRVEVGVRVVGGGCGCGCFAGLVGCNGCFGAFGGLRGGRVEGGSGKGVEEVRRDEDGDIVQRWDEVEAFGLGLCLFGAVLSFGAASG